MHYWENRDKYSADDLKKSLAKGHAMANANGDPSYPVEDQEDLEKAIHAVGRGGADHDAIRAHIMEQADRLGLSKLIPDNWNKDGSLSGQGPSSQQNSRKPHHRSLPLAPEVRSFSATGLEIRTAEGDSSGNTVDIVGSPIVYNTPYSVVDMLGEFEERMSPGVAQGSIDNKDDVRFLFDHDGLPLARTASGTMKLADSPDKLQFRATLDLRQQLANDLVIAIERGDINQMSCGFSVADDNWNDDYSSRTINRFQKMYDVSAVTYPASPTTNIEIAQRMLMGMPIESRARVRKMWSISTELRAGKVLSQKNADALTATLAAMHQADNAIQSLSAAHDEMSGHLNGINDRANGVEDEEGNEEGDVYQGNPDGSEDAGAGGSDTQMPPADGSGSRKAVTTHSLRLALDLARESRDA